MNKDEFISAQTALGWSVAKTAQELRVSTVAVYRWRKGERAIGGPVARLMEVLCANAEEG